MLPLYRGDIYEEKTASAKTANTGKARNNAENIVKKVENRFYIDISQGGGGGTKTEFSPKTSAGRRVNAFHRAICEPRELRL
jgi:hypothetical protein